MFDVFALFVLFVHARAVALQAIVCVNSQLRNRELHVSMKQLR